MKVNDKNLLMSIINSGKLIFFAVLITFSLSACRNPEALLPDSGPNTIEAPTPEGIPLTEPDTQVSNPEGSQVIPDPEEPYLFINVEGVTLETRINPPKGYTRLPSRREELTGFIRDLPLKEHNSDVLLYDGAPKRDQDSHVAVFSFDTGTRDLQQCADSVIRVYAEYYWSIQEYNKIAFHLTNGFLMEYAKWREGNRLKVNGNQVSWNKSKTYDDSYSSFRSYLDMVFAYAGTLSLSKETKPIELKDLQPGDMFLQGGSPGHCVLVVDIARDEHGNRCFLLAQGYMPAQDFHILVNPIRNDDPWYYETDITFPFRTPSWTFQEGSLVRWADFPLESNYPLSSSLYTPEAVEAMAGERKSSNISSDNKVTLLAAGDNLIHIEVVDSGRQTDGSLNYNHLYRNIKDLITAADLAIVNQETILGGAAFAYSGYPAFNSPIEIGEALAEAGFDIILHATNHTLDKGYKAVHNTLSFWKKYPEIKIIGIHESQEDKELVPIIEKNGIKIALLNYTYGLNGYKVPASMPYLVNLFDKKQMVRDIQAAKELADFIIVFPHWGTEYVYSADKDQIKLAEFFYENGVNLVIGTHPHVLQPIEWMDKGDGHRMLVYYSLGNFMSYQKEAPRMLGGLANITIVKDENGTYISEAGITPIVTHYEHGPKDYNFNIYKLIDYNQDLAKVHGVSDIARQGPISYPEIYNLAKKVLGHWFPD